jgi:catechol 2,3-dioxygenase-like lactoylglutathione lyase family enzyme
MSFLSIDEVVIHVVDIEASAKFYIGAFDLHMLANEVDSVLLGVLNSPTGKIRLREVRAREGVAPQVWDLGSRLLGMYSRDLASTLKRIEEAGGKPRPLVSYPYGGGEMREAIALGSDHVWWTLPEVGIEGPRQPSPALEQRSTRQHGELHTVVLVVEDVDQAINFFRDAGGMTLLFDGVMQGEIFEEMIGFPAGASLRIAFLAGPDKAPARIEFMSFEGVERTENLKENIGIRRIVMNTTDLVATLSKFVELECRIISENVIEGPAGIEVELREVKP